MCIKHDKHAVPLQMMPPKLEIDTALFGYLQSGSGWTLSSPSALHMLRKSCGACVERELVAEGQFRCLAKNKSFLLLRPNQTESREQILPDSQEQ